MSTAALRGLRDRLAGVGGPPFRAKLAQLCGAAALKLVADEFRGSHAPDGAKWAPLKSRRGKPLMDTGRLRASFATVPTADGFRIWTAVSYAGYHQSGTGPRTRKDRLQWVNKRGRFVARAKGPKMRGSSFRFLPGGTDAGIPARPMVPTGGALPPPWQEAMEREIAGAVRRQIQGGAP